MHKTPQVYHSDPDEGDLKADAWPVKKWVPCPWLFLTTRRATYYKLWEETWSLGKSFERRGGDGGGIAVHMIHYDKPAKAIS